MLFKTQKVSEQSQQDITRITIATDMSKPKPTMALSEEDVAECREAFNLFDTDGSGTIDARELKAACRAMGFTVRKQEVRAMLSDLGKDSDNEVIEFDDFCSLLAGRISNRDSREEIMKIFRLFTVEGSDMISFRDLKRVVTDLGEKLSDDDMMEMIEEADRNGDGKIDASEFARVMRKRSGNPLDDIDSDSD